MVNKLLSVVLFLVMSITTYSQTIKLTTWNIYMLPQIANSNYEKRAEYIADYLIENNSDILILQEGFNANARKIIYSKLKNIYSYQIEPIKANKFSLKVNCGLWILSKYPIVRQDFFKFSTCSGYDNLSQKGILYAEININGKIIQVFDTHLNSGQDKQSTRNIQYNEIKNFINEHSYNVSQIIAGDFNT